MIAKLDYEVIYLIDVEGSAARAVHNRPHAPHRFSRSTSCQFSEVLCDAGQYWKWNFRIGPSGRKLNLVLVQG